MAEIELVSIGRSPDGAEIFSASPTYPLPSDRRIAKPGQEGLKTGPLSWLGIIGSLTLAICLGIGA